MGPGTPGRITVAAGMGVYEVNLNDIVDIVNATSLSGRINPFKTFAEFFATASVQVSPRWILTLDYGHGIGSYNFTTQFGQTEFSVTTEMPSLVMHWVVLDSGAYSIRVGGGGGYHFGSLTESLGSQSYDYHGSGVGILADLEANTAFSEHLYVYIGGMLRWEIIGNLTSASGVSPIYSNGASTTLHSFAAGVRLGLTYIF